MNASLIAERSSRLVNLKEFSNTGTPDKVRYLPLKTPKKKQYILRMPIKANGGTYHVPKELDWTYQALLTCLDHQAMIGVRHPFCYVTVRSGPVESQTDDEWHVDGFSTRVPHIPEQNYIWCSEVGTEYVPLKVNFPDDFDSLRHNVNHFLQKFVRPDEIQSCKAQTLYCMDPYLLHRRPPTTKGMHRTFLRISFTPIEINDVNNTKNPELLRVYSQDGVSYRNGLQSYKECFK